jgi:hypothetical protein
MRYISGPDDNFAGTGRGQADFLVSFTEHEHIKFTFEDILIQNITVGQLIKSHTGRENWHMEIFQS